MDTRLEGFVEDADTICGEEQDSAEVSRGASVGQIEISCMTD